MSGNRLFLLLFVIPATSAYDKDINTTASSGSGTDQSSALQSSSGDQMGWSLGALTPSSSATMGASGSGKSSGGSSSDGSGSLYTWQWVLLLTALCCCKVMCLGGCYYAFCHNDKKKRPKRQRAVTKKTKTRPPAIAPASPPATMQAPLASPPSPLPTTSSLIPSYSMLNTRRPPEVAPSPTATVQLAAPPAATGYAGVGYAPTPAPMAMTTMAAPQAYATEAYAATAAYNPAMTAMTAPMAATSGYPAMAAPMMAAPLMAAPAGYAAPAATSYSQVTPGYGYALQ